MLINYSNMQTILHVGKGAWNVLKKKPKPNHNIFFCCDMIWMTNSTFIRKLFYLVSSIKI